MRTQTHQIVPNNGKDYPQQRRRNATLDLGTSQGKDHSGEELESTHALVGDGVDVLLGDHVAQAAAGRVLEGDAGGLGPQHAVDVVVVVELVVEALGDADGLAGSLS